MNRLCSVGIIHRCSLDPHAHCLLTIAAAAIHPSGLINTPNNSFNLHIAFVTSSACDKNSVLNI